MCHLVPGLVLQGTCTIPSLLAPCLQSAMTNSKSKNRVCHEIFQGSRAIPQVRHMGPNRVDLFSTAFEPPFPLSFHHLHTYPCKNVGASKPCMDRIGCMLDANVMLLATLQLATFFLARPRPIISGMHA